MRDRAPIRHVDYFWWSLGIFIGAFVIQNLLDVWFGAGPFLERWLALSPANIASGKIWTIFTYALLHANLQHFFFNGIMFFFVGRWLSRELEPKKFLHVIIGTVIMGGVVWVSLHSLLGSEALWNVPVIGFSAGVVGMMVTACLMWPHEKITLLLYFVLPVSLKPRILLWILLGIEFVGFFGVELAELLGYPALMASTNVAFSAHLGGALGGYLFYRLLDRKIPLFDSIAKKVSVEPPKWTKRRPSAVSGKFKVNLSNQKDFRQEVDRILDKINREGFQSLSPEEHKILDEAGDVLKK